LNQYPIENIHTIQPYISQCIQRNEMVWTAPSGLRFRDRERRMSRAASGNGIAQQTLVQQWRSSTDEGLRSELPYTWSSFLGHRRERSCQKRSRYQISEKARTGWYRDYHLMYLFDYFFIFYQNARLRLSQDAGAKCPLNAETAAWSWFGLNFLFPQFMPYQLQDHQWTKARRLQSFRRITATKLRWTSFQKVTLLPGARSKQLTLSLLRVKSSSAFWLKFPHNPHICDAKLLGTAT